MWVNVFFDVVWDMVCDKFVGMCLFVWIFENIGGKGVICLWEG